MGTPRDVTERQLQDAKQVLELRVQALQQKGIEQKAWKRDPLWRKLDAKARQIQARLRKLDQLAALERELAELKEKKLAAAAAPVEEAPAEEKKPKKAAKPEGKSEGKPQGGGAKAKAKK